MSSSQTDGLSTRTPALVPRVRELLASLNETGVVIAKFDDLFADVSLFSELKLQTGPYFAEARPLLDERVARTNPKSFKGHLLPRSFSVESLFVQLAISEIPLTLANSYLGVPSRLRDINVWLTVPTPGPATQTQLWHRDGDDRINLKMFVYLTDVTESAGPFCYAPRTHPKGEMQAARPQDNDGGGRSTDEQMAAVLPVEEQVVCAGPAGTVVLADTCGFHKQLKPTVGERLVYVAQYVTEKAVWPRTFEIPMGEADSLTNDQRVALAHY